MGKGIISGGGPDGLYSVEIQLETGSVDTEIARLQAQKAALDAQAAGMDAGLERSIVELKATAVQKRIEYLQDPSNVPENPTVSIWCADLTEDLSGNVGICEVAGQRENGYNIQPGYEDNAVYDETRDGKLVPAIATGAPHVFWNWAMRSGWQKWMPTYRWGTITEIDYELDTCGVSLEDEYAVDVDGTSVNQSGSLSSVPIEYMSCNSAAFEVGDEVLVEFEGNEWSGAKVIGFKEEPKACWWEPWDGPDINSKNPWVLYDPFSITNVSVEDGLLTYEHLDQCLQTNIVCPLDPRLDVDHAIVKCDVATGGGYCSTYESDGFVGISFLTDDDAILYKFSGTLENPLIIDLGPGTHDIDLAAAGVVLPLGGITLAIRNAGKMVLDYIHFYKK